MSNVLGECCNLPPRPWAVSLVPYQRVWLYEYHRGYWRCAGVLLLSSAIETWKTYRLLGETIYIFPVGTPLTLYLEKQ